MKKNVNFPLLDSGYPQLIEIIRAYSTWGIDEVTDPKIECKLAKENSNLGYFAKFKTPRKNRHY